MAEALENCLTCRRKTDNFLRISDESTVEDIGAVVAVHFWFQADQYEHRVLCTSCWEKIDDFHKFYNEVKRLWACDDSLPNSTVIKTERIVNEDGTHQQELLAYDLVKVEIAKAEESEKSSDEDDAAAKDKVEEEEESESSDDSDEDSAVPIAKRFRRAKPKPKPVKREKPIRKKRQVSNTPRAPVRKSRATNRREEFPFECEICDPVRGFKEAKGLQLHNEVCHTEDTEKKFQCDLCEKAFASEWQLSGHKSWHQKHHLNYFCEKCNKHFDSGRTLNNHIHANHPETAPGYLPASSDKTEDAATNDQQATESTEIPPNALLMPAPARPRAKAGCKALTPEEMAERDEVIQKFCTLICEKCGFGAENFYYLEKHYRNEHDLLGYVVCCNRKYFKKRKLYEHCLSHINPELYRCELCKRNFSDSDSLDTHNKRVHTPDALKPFKCDICEAAFHKEYLLKTHMKYHLSLEQKIYNCKDCDRSFGAATYLRTHQQTVHGAVSNWVCDICAKGFAHKWRLENHRLSHTAEGAASLKRQCDHCKRWLRNEITYKAHLMRCLSTNPVTCDLCGKESANELALVSHKRIHHTEQPVYTCSYCGKEFKRAIRHREHEANHRGEVLYQCPFCPYTCNSNSNMYTHKKVAHPDQWAAKLADKYYKR
ncbi:hypothetical protein RP20_CCG020606 [Aedes albopictus]|nr:hypothetical protein RP20_CCG020606 [Aedes albopictus]